MDENWYGYNINCYYNWVNMLIKMKKNKPHRFDEFDYSHFTIYHYLDKIQQEQNLYD